MKASNHRQRQWPPTIKDFRDPAPRTDQRLKILAREVHLLHSESDGIYGIRWINGMMFRLIVMDQNEQNIETVPLGRTRLRFPKILDFAQRGVVVSFSPNWMNVHVAPFQHQSGRIARAYR